MNTIMNLQKTIQFHIYNSELLHMISNHILRFICRTHPKTGRRSEVFTTHITVMFKLAGMNGFMTAQCIDAREHCRAQVTFQTNPLGGHMQSHVCHHTASFAVLFLAYVALV